MAKKTMVYTLYMFVDDHAELSPVFLAEVLGRVLGKTVVGQHLNPADDPSTNACIAGCAFHHNRTDLVEDLPKQNAPTTMTTQ
jgi:hypothetical protein